MSQVTNSLRNEDRILFTFLLACQLLMSEGKMDAKCQNLLSELCKTHDVANGRAFAPSPIPWLSREVWNFFVVNEAQHQDLTGKLREGRNEITMSNCFSTQVSARTSQLPRPSGAY